MTGSSPYFIQFTGIFNDGFPTNFLIKACYKMDFKKRLPTRIDTHLYLSPKLAATFVTLLAISYGSTAVAAPADQQAAERQAQELQRQAQERANQQYEQDRQSARESIQLDAIAHPPKPSPPMSNAGTSRQSHLKALPYSTPMICKICKMHSATPASGFRASNHYSAK